MSRVRLKCRDWVRTKFWDRNVDPGSTNYIDPGPCLTWQNHSDPTYCVHMCEFE